MSPIILCGPTASGKTVAAIELAKRLNAEIINADSGQIYRGLDIGTAKPTEEQQAEVPFHLLDILNPDQPFSAAEFCERSEEAMANIQKIGRQVIICGGTGLYLKALEEGLFEGPSRNPEIRNRLEKKEQEEGVESLHLLLSDVDPEAAKAIPPQNRQRLIRALEVYELTGKPISKLWKESRRGGSPWPLPAGQARRLVPTFIKYGLNPPKEELHCRINERVDDMMRAGLIAEAEHLVARWGSTACALKIIGYKEALLLIQEKLSKEEVVELIKLRTRQYAKRQMTWFKKDPNIRWFFNENELISYVLQNLEKCSDARQTDETE